MLLFKGKKKQEERERENRRFIKGRAPYLSFFSQLVTAHGMNPIAQSVPTLDTVKAHKL